MTRISASSACRAGRTEISTSLPKAFKNRKSRSMENPSSFPRRRAETLGWSMPRAFAALACVSFRSAMMSEMRCTSSAFARSSSGFLRPRSAKTFPLLGSTVSSVFTLAFLRTSCRMVFLRRFQPTADGLDFRRRCLNPALRLLLERMEHVHRTGELHGVHHAIGVPVVVFDDFEHPRPAEPLQHFRTDVLSSLLGLPEGEARRLADTGGERPQILVARPHPEERVLRGPVVGGPSMPVLA